ncbi:MAG: hypothetical protein KJ002_03270 [Candidatus Dadabacteria bacterium]|nr:hypothetical protein [Candidatus Dadabacteria bacterium]
MSYFAKRLCLVVFAFIAALLVAEGVARIFIDPVDYLWRHLSHDPVLRYKIEPYSAGHDSRGYRNKHAPEKAGIVALGDSQTYGESAPAKYSWPSILGSLTGKETYNMGIGGYGPAEYFYLFGNEALELKPEVVVAGFYLGNDLADTYTAVYTVERWRHLRRPGAGHDPDSNDESKADDAPQAEEARPVKKPLVDELKHGVYGAAGWFAENSVLYRVITASYLGDRMRQKTMLDRGEKITMIDVEEYGIHTGFTPVRRLEALDLDKENVREGLLLALGFFGSMNELAEENGVRFLVVILPTKESVYGEFIEGNPGLRYSAEIDRLLRNEKRVIEEAESYFRENGIPYINLLGPLGEAALHEEIYPNNYSGHFNGNGNRVIAESIKRRLDEMQ